jgi:hypothetical protein
MANVNVTLATKEKHAQFATLSMVNAVYKARSVNALRLLRQMPLLKVNVTVDRRV